MTSVRSSLALYLSRLLRPLWNGNLFTFVRDVPISSGDGSRRVKKEFKPSFNKAQLAKIETHLTKLKVPSVDLELSCLFASFHRGRIG